MVDGRLILAVDTSQKACSVSLCRGDQTLAARSEMLERGHAERLIPMIDEIVSEQNISYRDIERLAVITGPGAYTGVRIGVATVRGLALVEKIPCLGFTALEIALAEDKVGDGTFLSTVAGRGDTLFAQRFTKSSGKVVPLDQARSITLDEARSFEVDEIIGSGRVQLGLDDEITMDHMPNCNALAQMALSGRFEDHPAEPTYFRAADALPAKVIFEIME